jgi:acyl-CoA synthetase (AMP-forming)/AMP-acid ligase II
MALPVSAEWPAERSQEILDMTIGDLLREAAADSPATIALVEGSADPSARRRWSYGELLEEAERGARALLRRFAPGDHVAVWASNCPEWVALEMSAALAGVTLVTVNPALRAAELRHVLGQSRAVGIFVIPEYRGVALPAILDEVRGELPHLREVISLGGWEAFCASGEPTTRLPEVAPGDAVQIQYTSGTTGTPKGAVLHHRGVVNNARLYAERIGYGPGDVHLSPMPLFHTAGCFMSVLGAMASRATLVLPPLFEPALMLELIESERANSVLGVPTMLIAMLDHPRFAETDVSSMRRVGTGGAVVAPALVRRIEDLLGVRVSIVFAQTEASPVITQTRPDDDPEDRMTTLGRPLPQTDVRIVDVSTGKTAAPGVIGEICTRGYHVMTGYFDNPEATADAIDPDGWLHTGDLGSMDERGYCRIGGRLKDMIIRGGENIYPREIEQVLFDHEDVAEVAVVGIPDPVWGEQVAAFIRPAAGRVPDTDALFAYCRERLAPHKTPRHWRVVDAFPMTPSGKVQKYVLREQFAGAPDVAAAAPRAASA